MNNLVLVRVTQALNCNFAGGVLRDVRQDDAHRFRLLFDVDEGGASIIVSLRPELPWIGRPQGRWPGLRRVKHAFAGTCGRALGGCVLTTIDKDPADRVVHLRFADGQSLVAELATHGANLVLLDTAGRVRAAARNPRRARERLGVGEDYVPPRFPARLLDPFATDSVTIDALIAAHAAEGEAPTDVLRRRVFGVGDAAIDLLLRECRGDERLGGALARRIADITAGRVEPVVEAPSDPLLAAEGGTLKRRTCRLLPWSPDEPPGPGLRYFRRADAAATGGLYHEALERLTLVDDRWSALRTLVERELGRLTTALGNAGRDLDGFSDPQRHRVFGEALLAGLRSARVEGAFAMVPDPYATPDDTTGAVAEIAVPVPPGTSLTEAAQAHFDKHRRSLRGLERARLRVKDLTRQRSALAAIVARYAGATDLEALLAMELALRQQGMPVALEPPTRSGRALHRVTRPRLEGVRVLSGRGGNSILVGKGGRENDRLTFRLAAPEDLWFHALGRPGAHVLVRWPSEASAKGGDAHTGKRPPPDLVAEAAAVAAWYSEGRGEAWLDVQWTRRKYVRRRRGAEPGAVIIKKFETVRVRPALPASSGQI